MSRPARLRRLVLALCLCWTGLVLAYLGWPQQVGTLLPAIELTTGEHGMNRLALPTLVCLLGLVALVSVGCASHFEERAAQREALRAEQAALAAQQAAQRRHRFAAQVVGVQWLNPLQRRDYPTEWQALWTLGLAKPNKDDDVVPVKPEKYSKVGPVAGIAFNLFGDQTFSGYFQTYVVTLFGKFWERYFMEKNYFYSVAKGRSPRREVAGMRIEFALPNRLDLKENVDFASHRIGLYFATDDPRYSSTGEPPDIRPHVGGPAAGFRALDAALDYLEAHPDKTVWVAAFDAPDFPKDEQLSETGALLILAHPDYATGREALAWIHRPQREVIEAGKTVSAWRAGLDDAAKRGQLAPDGIGYVIHDAGQGDDAAGRRLGPLMQALSETTPERDVLAHSFNTTALLGDLRAGTAATNLVLAIAYAYHRNTPVVVAGTRETQAGEALPGEAAPAAAVTTVLVRPPAKPVPFDPDKNWFRARGEGNAYLPWWGQRVEAGPRRMQGWAD